VVTGFSFGLGTKVSLILKAQVDSSHVEMVVLSPARASQDKVFGCLSSEHTYAEACQRNEGKESAPCVDICCNSKVRLIARFYLVDRGLRHRLPGCSSLVLPARRCPAEAL
jgi:hypothetical protein